MFYDQFINLCNKKGISPSKAALINNISKTSVTRWKNGAIPNAEILQKLSEYFNVSTDYLLGNISKNQETFNKAAALIQNSSEQDDSLDENEAFSDILKIFSRGVPKKVADLSKVENNIIDAFRDMNKKGKNKIIEYISDISKIQEYKKDE